MTAVALALAAMLAAPLPASATTRRPDLIHDSAHGGLVPPTRVVTTHWGVFGWQDADRAGSASDPPLVSFSTAGGASPAPDASGPHFFWRVYVADTWSDSRYPLQAFTVRLSDLGSEEGGGIEYMAHVQNVGDQPWVSDGAVAGTVGQALRLEAFAVRLTGGVAEHYGVRYLAVCAVDHTDIKTSRGSDGSLCGFKGQSRPITRFEVWLYERTYSVRYEPNGGQPSAITDTLGRARAEELRGEGTFLREGRVLVGWNTEADGTGTPYALGETVEDLAEEGGTATLYAQWEGADTLGRSGVALSVHHANVSWTDAEMGGGYDPGDGDNWQLQSFAASLVNLDGVDGGISYQAHLQNYGNYAQASDGAQAAPTGLNRTIEDLRIWLTGTIAECYSVRYHVTFSNGRRHYVPQTAKPAEPTAAYSPLKLETFYGSPAKRGRTFTSEDGAWAAIGRPAPVDGSFVAYSYYGVEGDYSVPQGEPIEGGLNVSVRSLSVELVPREYTHRVRYRLQSADGSWGAWVEGAHGTYAYASTVPEWSLPASPLHKAAVVPAHIAGHADETIDVDVERHARAWTLEVVAPDGSVATDSSVATCDVTVNLESARRNCWTQDRNSLLMGSTVTIANIQAAHGLMVASVEAEGAELVDNGDGSWTLEVGTADVVLRISTAPNSYTLHFVAEDAEEGVPADLVLACGEAIEVPGVWPQRSGWVFTSWLLPDGITTCLPGDTIDSLCDDGTVSEVSLTAQWAAILRVRVPVAVRYSADSSGRLIGPRDGTIAITNDSATDVWVTKLRVDEADGVTIVEDDPGDGEVWLMMRPGDGTEISLATHTGKERAPTVPTDWRLAAGSSLFLNELYGRMGTADIGGEYQVGSIHWTFEAE